MELLFQKLTLPDIWQQEAVRALRDGKDVIVDAPTGAGKTMVFELFVEDAAWTNSNRQAVFTVPTRALANDKWAEWKDRGWDVGIATGDLAVNTKAPIIVATLETQRERFLHGKGPALLVVDEYQMISDPARGVHYELILTLTPPDCQLLLLSGSVGNAERIAEWLRSHERQVSLITTRDRPVPLDDVHLLGLPYQAPKSIKTFWPRLAVETLLADMGPLLIFVPHRKGAENVARQIAEALPLQDPLELTTEQRQLAGKELQKMLARRVCYHHSGLHYELRASLLEPLARHGQLRVIVATMGLAAGINFSVRSVFVAESTYHDGPFLHQLQPDELLQMFGRAGRRGKDTAGFVIHGDKNPRLANARAGELHRANEIDWPTLVRIMHLAAEKGDAPFQAAEAFCSRLFSNQPILLGTESSPATTQAAPDTSYQSPKSFGLGATRKEILNSQKTWEPFEKKRQGSTTLGQVLAFEKEQWRPANTVFDLIAKRTQLGRTKKAPDQNQLIKEIVLASRKDAEAPWKPAKSVARNLPRRLRETFTDERTTTPKLLEALTEPLAGGEITRTWIHGNQLLAEAHFNKIVVSGYQDQSGAWLLAPRERVSDVSEATDIVSEGKPSTHEPPPDSPVHSWRSLGLIQADGTPTRRGVLFSFFYHGEGLAIAAGLEAENYPIEDLLWHLANLRSGHRFKSFEGTDSERLTIVCRQTYGPVNHPSYLRLGVPIQYGEGAAELVRNYFDGKRTTAKGEDDFGKGDLERALHEWMSLLRQVSQAPDYPWARWQEFQRTAKQFLETANEKVRPFTMTRSSLSGSQAQPFTKHGLRPHHLKR